MFSDFKEMQAYIIYILKSLIKFTVTFDPVVDRKLGKELQEIVENLFDSVDDSFKWTEKPLNLYYPENETESNVGSLVLTSFSRVGLNVILFTWPDMQQDHRENNV